MTSPANTDNGRNEVRRAVIDGTIKGDWDQEQRQLALLIAHEMMLESQQFFNSALADIERYGRYIADAHAFFSHFPAPADSVLEDDE